MTVSPKPPPWRPPSPLPQRFQTERLALRYFMPEDAESLLAALSVDRSSLLPWMPWALTDNRTLPETYFTIEKARRIRERTDPPADDFLLGIFDRATNDVVGGTGYHRMTVEAGEAEVGYWIRADRRRQGLCTEAMRALLTWGFTPQSVGGWGFRRLHVRCAGRNEASAGVPIRLGLRREIHVKDARWVEGIGYDDTLGWGVLADEWDLDAQGLRRA